MKFLNKIPGVGHGKAIYHRLLGEKEEADEAWRTANRSTVVIGGAIIAGPVGAMIGGVSVDVVHSIMYCEPIGVVEDFYDMCYALEEDKIPWKGAGKMVVRSGFDAVHGTGMDMAIVRTALRPCL